MAISQFLQINPKKAEKIKIQYNISDMETNDRSKKIFQAISPILDNLVTQIKKYINFYQDHSSHEHLSSDEKIGKIFLCGGGAGLKGLPKFLSLKLGIPVELGYFWKNFSSKQLNNDTHQNSLSFVTALGLALRGAKNIEINN